MNSLGYKFNDLMPSLWEDITKNVSFDVRHNLGLNINEVDDIAYFIKRELDE